MGGGDIGAVGQGTLSDDRQHKGLAPHALVDLVSGFELHAGGIGNESRLLRLPDALGHGFPFRTGGVQKCLVILAIGFQFQPLGYVDQVIALLLLVKQPLAQLVFLFFHALYLLKCLLCTKELPASGLKLL